MLVDLLDAVTGSYQELPWYRWWARQHKLIIGRYLITIIHEGDRKARLRETARLRKTRSPKRARSYPTCQRPVLRSTGVARVAAKQAADLWIRLATVGTTEQMSVCGRRHC